MTRMTDERLAEIVAEESEFSDPRCFYEDVISELLQALKAEREYVQELENEMPSIAGAVGASMYGKRIRELEQQVAEYEARDSRFWHSVQKRTDGQAERIRQLEDLLTTGYDLVAESIADSRQYDFPARAELFVCSAQEALADG